MIIILRNANSHFAQLAGDPLFLGFSMVNWQGSKFLGGDRNSEIPFQTARAESKGAERGEKG